MRCVHTGRRQEKSEQTQTKLCPPSADGAHLPPTWKGMPNRARMENVTNALCPTQPPLLTVQAPHVPLRWALADAASVQIGFQRLRTSLIQVLLAGKANCSAFFLRFFTCLWDVQALALCLPFASAMAAAHLQPRCDRGYTMKQLRISTRLMLLYGMLITLLMVLVAWV